MTDHPIQQYDDLIRSAAQRLRGHQRRLFQAEVANSLCGGSPRADDSPAIATLLSRLAAMVPALWR